MVIFLGGTPALLEPLWGVYVGLVWKDFSKQQVHWGWGAGGKMIYSLGQKWAIWTSIFFFIFLRNILVTKSPLFSPHDGDSPGFSHSFCGLWQFNYVKFLTCHSLHFCPPFVMIGFAVFTPCTLLSGVLEWGYCFPVMVKLGDSSGW